MDKNVDSIKRIIDNHAEQSRAEWIDAARGFAILIVVLGHTSTNAILNRFIYGFHMPFFFFLSGYLYISKKNPMKYVKRTFKGYIIPYVILCSINLCLEIIRNHQTLNICMIVHWLIGIIYSRGTTEWMPNCSPLWFLTGFFWAVNLYNMIQECDSKNMRVIWILLCVLISQSLSIVGCPKLPWNIDTALMAVGFVAAGNFWYLFRRNKTNLGYCICALMVVMALLCIRNNTENVNFDGNRYGNVILMTIGALGICIPILELFQKRNIRLRILQFYGRHTLLVMGFDYFSTVVGVKLLSIFGLQHWIFVFLSKIFLLAIGIQLWTNTVKLIPNAKIKKYLQY